MTTPIQFGNGPTALPQRTSHGERHAPAPDDTRDRTMAALARRLASSGSSRRPERPVSTGVAITETEPGDTAYVLAAVPPSPAKETASRTPFTDSALAAARQLLKDSGVTVVPLTGPGTPPHPSSLFHRDGDFRTSWLNEFGPTASLTNPEHRARIAAALEAEGGKRSAGITARRGHAIPVPPRRKLAVVRGGHGPSAGAVELLD